MFQKYEDFETVALVGLALVFEVAERLRPARSHDRRRGLRLDIVALIVLLVAAGLARNGIVAAFQHLTRMMGEIPGRETIRGLPSAARVGLAMVSVDFTLYWIHRAMHAWGPLWRSHRWHHSPEELWWFSGFRTSAAQASGE